MMNIHISGANGFLGKALIDAFSGDPVNLFPWVRRSFGFANEIIVPDLLNTVSINNEIRHCDVFIHLAAKVHQLRGDKNLSAPSYQTINCDMTLELANAALNAGVKHFIYVSSVKVNGEETKESAFVETDYPNPKDPYGFSKWEAEQALMELSQKSGLIVTIIRPPLVYGPEVGANFLSLLRWLYWSMPMPFRFIKNSRSLIFVGNLVSAIKLLARSNPGRSGTYLVSDGEDLSSHQLASKLSLNLRAFNLPLPIPVFFLQIAGKFFKLEDQISRLTCSLQVNSHSFREHFNWTPPFTVDEGLKATADWYLEVQRQSRLDLVKRIMDLILSSAAIFILIIPVLIICLLVKLSSPGPIIYWSDRMGVNNRLFKMPKFRSMRIGTPVVATHLLDNPADHLTPIGLFLRRSSLDELPQLFSVLVGQMSLVGPRPALFNQDDLILLRTRAKVHKLRPGVTGWAQINGRDELDINAKVNFDREYLERRSIVFDTKILFLTVFKVLRSRDISH